MVGDRRVDAPHQVAEQPGTRIGRYHARADLVADSNHQPGSRGPGRSELRDPFSTAVDRLRSSHTSQSSMVRDNHSVRQSISSGGPGVCSNGTRSMVSTRPQLAGRRSRCRAIRSAHSGSADPSPPVATYTVSAYPAISRSASVDFPERAPPRINVRCAAAGAVQDSSSPSGVRTSYRSPRGGPSGSHLIPSSPNAAIQPQAAVRRRQRAVRPSDQLSHWPPSRLRTRPVRRRPPSEPSGGTR